VANREQLAILADIGVVLLLFEVGIEINPIHLARQRRLLVLAPVQVMVTWLLAGLACLALGVDAAGAALVGLSIAMSSSVVVVNITRSVRRTTDARTDEALLGWSVIQDLLGVSCALVLLIVIGLEGRSGATALGETAAFVALAIAAALVLPWLLTRLKAEHDLFLLVSVGSGLLLAGVGSRFFAIPLALAAFVAGLAITESPVAGEARERLLPFRDVFAVMFFVSLAPSSTRPPSPAPCPGSGSSSVWSWSPRSCRRGRSPDSAGSGRDRCSSPSASARLASSATYWARWP
jgi:CPA2 family monovalent cation:H+ antiporter-2